MVTLPVLSAVALPISNVPLVMTVPPVYVSAAAKRIAPVPVLLIVRVFAAAPLTTEEIVSRLGELLDQVCGPPSAIPLMPMTSVPAVLATVIPLPVATPSSVRVDVPPIVRFVGSVTVMLSTAEIAPIVVLACLVAPEYEKKICDTLVGSATPTPFGSTQLVVVPLVSLQTVSTVPFQYATVGGGGGPCTVTTRLLPRVVTSSEKLANVFAL